MLPRIEIGMFNIPSFAFMIWLGVIAFTLMTIYILEKKENLRKEITNRILIVCVIGLAALAIFAFAFNSLFHSIASGTLKLGGITWLGGVLGAFPVMVLCIHFLCPKVKGNALFYFNLLIPAICLGHFFGRIGCFCGGCCYGGVTDSIFGVVFPEGSLAATTYPAPDGRSLPVFPTQLFEAVFELLSFTAMMVFYKKLRERFLETYCFGYGIFRFLAEFLRGDNRGATGFALSPSQLMSIVLLLIGVLLVLYRQGRVFKKLAAKMQAYREETNVYGVNLRGEVNGVLKQMKNLQKYGMITDEEYTLAEQDLTARITKKPVIDNDTK
jgi:phosphatidylglycerol:prolipoprotein diacylglycerol transferase